MFGYYKFKKKVKKIFTRKNKETDFVFIKRKDDLFLFGNGYSLKNYQLQNINDSDCFICNLFFRMPYFEQFVKNNNVIDFSIDSFASYVKISKKRNRPIEEILEEDLNPKIGIGIPLVKTEDFHEYILKVDPNQLFIDYDSFLKKIVPNEYTTIKKRFVKNFGHTPQFMLLIGILLGYKKIHLFGLEHNYVKDILNKSPLCGTHFYNDTYEDVLLKDGHSRDREKIKIKLSQLLRGNADVFEGYEKLADLAKERGVEIIDHSGGSLFMFQDYSLWDLVEPTNK
jgi:hypothetical protein